MNMLTTRISPAQGPFSPRLFGRPGVWGLGLLATLFTVFSHPAHAGACLCLKSNGEEITEFSCKNLDGNNACGAHCAATGFPGSEYYAMETCDSLRKKIKRQEIEVPIPNLKVIKEAVEIVDIVTGQVIEQQIIQLPRAQAGTDEQSGNRSFESFVAAVSPAPVPGPGQTVRRVVDAEASFVGGTDTFEVPLSFGGGWHTTNAFGGDFTLRLVQHTSNPDLYDVFVTAVNTLTPSMDLNGFSSGVLNGSLNQNAPNQGLYNDATGQISLLFSQFLVADSYPDTPMLTYTTYSGFCADCLSGGKTFVLYGDSLYVSPVE